MRCVFVTTSFPTHDEDAAGHFVRTEAQARAGAGDEVIVVTAGRTPGRRGDGGLQVVTLPGGSAFGWPGVAARLASAPWSSAAAAKWVHLARNCVRDLAPAEIVAHWVLPCAWPIASHARRAGRPDATRDDGAGRSALRVVGVSHGADVRLLLALPHAVRDRLVRRLCDVLASWRFVSLSLMTSLTRVLPADLCRRLEPLATVAASPIDLPLVSANARDARRREIGAANVMSIVGRLTPGKRVDRAIDYAKGRGADTHLVIVGDGPERARLQRYARHAGVAATFVGQASRTEAVTWIAASDELVIASRAEGLSTVAREAEALGVRVTRV